MQGRFKLYFNPQSRAAVVRWMLNEVGADYDLVPVDFEKGELVPDDVIKTEFAQRRPYGEWLQNQRVDLE